MTAYDSGFNVASQARFETCLRTSEAPLPYQHHGGALIWGRLQENVEPFKVQAALKLETSSQVASDLDSCRSQFSITVKELYFLPNVPRYCYFMLNFPCIYHYCVDLNLCVWNKGLIQNIRTCLCTCIIHNHRMKTNKAWIYFTCTVYMQQI